MKKSRIGALIGLFAVVCVVVGVMVWPVPKEANAETFHVIEMTLNGGAYAQGVLIEFGVQVGPDPNDPDDWAWEPTLTNQLGKAVYSSTPYSTATYWVARMIDDDYDPINPIANETRVYYPAIFFTQQIELK